MSALDVFADVSTDVAEYRVRLQVKEKMVGGVPSDPSVIRKWLESRLDADDKVLTELAERTLKERFEDRQPETRELVDAIIASGEGPSVNGFKRHPDTGELVYEGRCMKAAIKEWANSAYPGTEWDGKKSAKGVAPRKGLMSTLAERVFVPDTYIGLGAKEPSCVEERIKHVMTPQGPRSSLNRVEVVERPTLSFILRVHDDFLAPAAWARIWQRGEDIGIGADRGRSDGMFELLAFDRALA